MSWRKRACHELSMAAAVLLAGVGVPLAARADDAVRQYNLATGYFLRKQFDFAADEYERFLKSYPEHAQAPAARFFLGEAYFQLGRMKEARHAYQLVVQKHPNYKYHAYALYRLGESSYLLADYSAAADALAEFVSKQPNSSLLERALPYLGRAQLALGQFDQARVTLQAGLQRFPNGPLVAQNRYDLARALQRLGQIVKAMDLYRLVAADQSHPLADDAQLAIGLLLFEQKQYEPAGRTFRQFLQRFPNSPLVPTAELNRGLCLYQLGRYAEAEPVLAQQSKGDVAVAAQASYWLGLTQLAAGNYDAAADTLLAAYKRFGDHRRASAMLYQGAEALFLAGKYPEAVERFVEFSSRFSDDELADESLERAVAAALAAGRHQQAADLAELFLKQFPASKLGQKVLLSQAQALIGRSEPGRAAQLLDRLLADSRDPAVTRPARYYKAVALQSAGKLAEALEALQPLLSESETDEVAADARYLAAVWHFQQQGYNQAAPLLEQYLKLRPAGQSAGHALSYLCLCLAELGQWDRLPERLAELRKQAPPSLAFDTLYRVAELCYAAGQYVRAAALYQEVTGSAEAGPLQLKALSGLAWAEYQQGRFAQAAERFARLAAQSGKDPLAAEAAYMYAKSLEAGGQYRKAIDAYQAVPKGQQAFRAGLQRARLLQRTGEHEQAAKAYQQLAQDFPQSKQLDTVLNEWAWVHLSQGDEQRGRQLLERLLKQFPDSPLAAQATLNLCEGLFQDGRFKDVLDRLQPLLNRRQVDRPVREAALYRVGRTQVELKQWAEAKAAFETLLAEFPDSSLAREATFWTAEAQRQLGETQAAARRLEQLVQQPGADEPWLPMAWLRLAQCQGELKQWKAVLETTRQLRERFPQFPLMNAADYQRGRALQSLAQFDQARAAYGRAVAGRSDETAARSQFMIAETYFHQRRYRQALREFLKVEILYPFPRWQAAALLEAGKCQELLDQWPRAAETYQRILDKYGQTEHAAEAAQRLKLTRKKLAARNPDQSKGGP